MKRVLTFLAIMLLPLSVMAMTPVTDSDLADVTGQAGVNINADLTMNIGIGVMAWGDQGGLEGYPAINTTWGTVGGAGYVGVTGFNIYNLRIKARETDAYDGWTYPTQLKPITIDVATDTNGVLYGGNTFVRFGLGSLQITLDSLQFSVEMGATTGLGQQLGVASLGAIGIYIDPVSYVDIYAHGGSGVSITMNIEVDEFQMDYISWGDTDGLPAGNISGDGTTWMAPGPYSAAGFVGLDDLVIGGPITITGTVAIDVVTSLAGIYAHTGTPIEAPVTVVHISFPDLFNVNVAGPITANVKLDSVAGLSNAGAGVLGDIYIAGFNLDILAGSWVDIWAH